MPTPRILVEIALALANFQADFGRAQTIAERNSKAIQRSVQDIEQRAISLGRTIAGAIGVPLTAAAAFEFFDTLKEKVSEDERSVNQLNAVLVATGGAAGLTRQALAGITSELHGTTIFDDEKIRAAETALLRFRAVQGDTFREAIQLVPDVAAGLGTDLPSAAQALGRALEDPGRGLRALKAAGVELSEPLIDMAARMREAGDRAGAMKIVIDAVRESFGGAADADTKGMYGATKRLTRALDDLEKTGGKKFFGDNHGVIEALTDAMERLRKKAEDTDFSLKRLFSEPGYGLRAAVDAVGAAFGTADQKGREARGTIGNLGLSPEEAAAADAAREARVRERTDQAYADQQAALKRRAAAAGSAFAFELAQQKSALDLEQSQYEFAYGQAYVSAKEFYGKLREEAERSAKDQQVNLGKQGLLQEAVISAPSANRDEREAARARLQQIANQSDQAALDLKKRILEIDQQQALAIERLKDEYSGLAIKLQELRGDSVGAAGASFDLSNKALRQRLDVEVQRGDALSRIRAQAALADLEALRERTVQQAALNKIEQDFSVILDVVNVVQARIDLRQSTGAITELDALRQKGDAAKALIPQLTAVADAYEKIALATKDPAAVVAVEKLRLEIDQLAAQSDALAKKFTDVFSGAVADGISELVSGTKSARDVIKDIAKSIETQITQIASKNVAEQLFGKNGPLGGVGEFFAGIFGGKGGGGGIGDLGLAAVGSSAPLASTGLSAVALAAQSAAAALSAVSASSVGGGAANLFGGFPGFGGAFGGGSLFGGFGDAFGFPGFAAGTDFAPGGMALVGERGPELVNLPRGAQVVPNAKFGSRAGQHFYQTVNVTVAGSVTTKSADQIGIEVARHTRRALARHG